MNGYFQRLIARGTGVGSQVRPLSRQPHAIRQEERPFTVSDEWVAHAPRLFDSVRASRGDVPDNPSAAKAAEKADMAGTRQPPPVVDNQTTSASTTTRDSGEKPLRRPEPASERAPVMNEDKASTIRDTRASPAKPDQPLDPAITPHPIRQETPLPVKEFRLMPLQPRSAPDAAPSKPVRPFSLASGDVRSQRHANPTSPEQHNNKHGEQEPHTVQVTIGRVEIRATVASTPARKTPARSPTMSLDEYLKQRNGSKG